MSSNVLKGPWKSFVPESKNSDCVFTFILFDCFECGMKVVLQLVQGGGFKIKYLVPDNFNQEMTQEQFEFLDNEIISFCFEEKITPYIHTCPNCEAGRFNAEHK